MIELREILCPVDFSESSRHALAHAVVLAKWYESRLTVLHVMMPPLFAAPPVLMVGFPGASEAAETDPAVCERTLHAWLEPAKAAGLATVALVDRGRVHARILDAAASRRADLVVMGSHGLGGFEQFVIGSITARVLRKASCPVLTVPPAAATAATLPYKRILCPIDFSEPSLRALRYALSLAEEADATLTMLHVFDWAPADERLVGRFDVAAYRRSVEEQARRDLEALVPAEVRNWCQPVTRVAQGKPYLQILDAAAQDGADLIVIGVHGRNPIDLTLFGSTTNHVVQRASCAVLTLRS